MRIYVYPGETLGLVGESGSGKTTLSRTVLLLEKPSSGEIFYNGKDIVGFQNRKSGKLRKRNSDYFPGSVFEFESKDDEIEILTAPMKVHSIGQE